MAGYTFDKMLSGTMHNADKQKCLSKDVNALSYTNANVSAVHVLHRMTHLHAGQYKCRKMAKLSS